MVLTGTGQGVASDADWATAYLGPGPWGSLVPALPSNPSQAYEGIGTLAVLSILTIVVLLGGFRNRDGRLFFVAIGLWAIVRAFVSTTWRDPVVAAGLNAGGLHRRRDRDRLCRGPADPHRPPAGARHGRCRRPALGPGGLARPRDAPALLTEEYRDDSHQRGPPMTQVAEPGSARTDTPTPGRVSHWVGGSARGRDVRPRGPGLRPCDRHADTPRRSRLGRGGRSGRRCRQGRVPGMARDLALEAHRHHVQDPEPGRGQPPRACRPS